MSNLVFYTHSTIKGYIRGREREGEGGREREREREGKEGGRAREGGREREREGGREREINSNNTDACALNVWPAASFIETDRLEDINRQVSGQTAKV